MAQLIGAVLIGTMVGRRSSDRAPTVRACDRAATPRAMDLRI
jgi:hypothetical protein